jgi:hypothetical protein
MHGPHLCAGIETRLSASKPAKPAAVGSSIRSGLVVLVAELTEIAKRTRTFAAVAYFFFLSFFFLVSVPLLAPLSIVPVTPCISAIMS